MPSYKKRIRQKTYKERPQPSSRTHLGLLEKHKDYVLRAKDHHQKKEKLKALQREAAMKNPEEFYYKMIRSKKKNGVHLSEQDLHPHYDIDTIKKFKSEDHLYLTMQNTSEHKKLKKLEASYQLLSDATPEEIKNSHIIFTDTKENAATLNISTYFQTPSHLLTRIYNRPTEQTIENGSLLANQQPITEDDLIQLQKSRENAYKEFAARTTYQSALNSTIQKLELQRNLMNDSNVIKIYCGNQISYKWRQNRKK